jgi:hypothetical protein
MPTLVYLLGLILLIMGVVTLLQGQILFGVILIVVGLVIGQSGYTVPRRRGML